MYACRLRISPLCYFCWYYILLIFFIIYSALAAASSPLGVVSGAIAGHGAATVVSTRDSQVAKFLVTVIYLKLCGSHYTKYRIKFHLLFGATLPHLFTVNVFFYQERC